VRPTKKGLRNSVRAVSQVGSFGLLMGSAILIGYYVGSYLDKKLGTSPWLMLLFLLLFMVGAFVKFIQETKEVANNSSKKR